MEIPNLGVQIILFFLKLINLRCLVAVREVEWNIACSAETQRLQWKLLLPGGTDFQFSWLFVWHPVESPPPPILWLGSGICAQPSAALESFRVCVSSILWELTFPLLLPRRKQQLLRAVCSLNTACQLACHIMPAWSKCVHPSYISIIPLAIELIIGHFPACFKDERESTFVMFIKNTLIFRYFNKDSSKEKCENPGSLVNLGKRSEGLVKFLKVLWINNHFQIKSKKKVFI